MDEIRFMTIRETAATGILPETYLRRMVKQHNCPGIQAGNTFRVNYNMLVEQLNRESAANAVSAQGGVPRV